MKAWARNHWRALFLIAAIVSFSLNILRLHYSYAYNSDGVELQNILYFWQHHQHQLTFLGDDNFFFKLPFYVVLEHLGLTPRNTQLLAFSLFMALSFTALYIALTKMGRLFGWFKDHHVAVGLLYLISLNKIYEYTIISNVRNLELGLVFLLVLPAAIGFKRRLRPLWWILSTLVLSFFIFSDPYFAYAFVLPLLVILAINLRLSKKDRPLRSAPILFLSASLVFWRLWHVLVDKLKIRTISFPIKFLTLGSVLSNIKFWFIALIALGGAEYSNGVFHSVPWVFFINAPLLVLMIIYSAYLTTVSLKKFRNDPWKTFIVAMPLFISLIYILQTPEKVQDFRYLILAAFSLPALVAFALAQTKLNLRWWLAGLILVVTFANSFRAGQTVLAGDQKPNQINYQIAAAVRNLGLSKGYSDYWNAGINTYFSKDQIKFLQISCDQNQKLQPMYWLVDSGEYKAKAARTFYLFDNTSVYTQGCSPQQNVNQLGQPSQIVKLNGRYELAIYNYDIFQKLATPVNGP